jgi:16S rRNA (uracil1498-N3)-methyltransferase
MALRRIHSIKSLVPGTIELDPAEAHHVRDVLRLKVGDRVEAFDDAGNVGSAVIQTCDAGHVVLRIEQIHVKNSGPRIVIASAVPKGERADWMIEKLSELGVSRFIPLETARSVVHPKGSGKRERWIRIATEAAKQSRRAGVMEIDELTSVQNVLNARPQAAEIRLFLSTESNARSIFDALLHSPSSTLHPPLCLFIGPEGGWTEQEIQLFESSHLTAVLLTGTILRVETAAIAAATVATLVASAEARS